MVLNMVLGLLSLLLEPMASVLLPLLLRIPLLQHTPSLLLDVQALGSHKVQQIQRFLLHPPEITFNHVLPQGEGRPLQGHLLPSRHEKRGRIALCQTKSDQTQQHPGCLTGIHAQISIGSECIVCIFKHIQKSPNQSEPVNGSEKQSGFIIQYSKTKYSRTETGCRTEKHKFYNK